MDTGNHESGIAAPSEDQPQIPAVREAGIGGGKLHPNALQVGGEITRLLRAPFQRLLADYLGCAPTAEAIRKFADKSPDRWVQGLVMLGQMAGYTKDIHVTSDSTLNVHLMSDTDVRERLQAARAALGVAQSTAALPLPLPSPKTNVPRETLRANEQTDHVTDVDYSECQPRANPD